MPILKNLSVKAGSTAKDWSNISIDENYSYLSSYFLSAGLDRQR